jgi:hypothetical protein
LVFGKLNYGTFGGLVERTPVDSSNVCAVAYDPQAQVMEVEFGKGTEPGEAGNRLYRYSEVPAHVHEELMEAPSVGSYINRAVAYQFSYEFLGTVEALEP